MKSKTKELSPLFITGVWRSGTTLISRMLNNHSELDITYDTVHFMRFSYNKYNPLNKNNIAKLINDMDIRLQKRYGFYLSTQDIINSIPDRANYADVYNAIMNDFLLRKSKKLIWGEKTNLAWTEIPDFFSMYPDGRVIHIIRDPRAVLASWKKFTHAPGNDYLDSILNCYDSMDKALIYKNKFENFHYAYLTYENLVRYPEETVKLICQKLNLNYCEKLLDVELFNDKFGEKWSANTIYNESLKGISVAVIDKWRDILEDWEILLSDILTENMLLHFGYCKNEDLTTIDNYDKAINEVLKSKLTTEGMIRFLLYKKGFERYPSDPSCESNWGSL